MTFADIPDGQSLFIDANIFVYHAVPHATFGPACRQLMERVGRQEINAFASADVLSDVAHRMMTLEGSVALQRSLSGMASYLKKHPAAIQQLSRFRQTIEEIVQIGVHILPSEGAHVLTAGKLSQQAS